MSTKSNKHASAILDQSKLPDIVRPHVESFNYFTNYGLSKSTELLDYQYIQVDKDNNLPDCKLWLTNAYLEKPSRGATGLYKDPKIYPNECREASETYSGVLKFTVNYQTNSGEIKTFEKNAGNLPIMVMSDSCHLSTIERSKFTKFGEEQNEQGGYFILNGNERLIRMIIMPRRNIVLGINRSSYAKRGPNYTTLACTIRCVRPDQSAVTVTMHYLNDGSITVRFSLNKQEFFIPLLVVMRALVETTDYEIFTKLLSNGPNTFMSERIEAMMREISSIRVKSRRDNIAFLGSYFRLVMQMPSSVSDEEVGTKLLDNYILVHCVNNQSKFDLLIYMAQKLYSMAAGDCLPDNGDALHTHEILLPGHLYTMFVKEKMQEVLVGARMMALRESKENPSKVDFNSETFWRRIFDKQINVGQKIEYFLKTGNLITSSGLDLMQVSGFTVVADRLNHNRFMSHFRSVHRGQFFTTMKTTTVRKLLPESWGFMCPVHTPDGAPCGLLNHLAHACDILTHPCKVSFARIVKSLVALGLRVETGASTENYISVLLDGNVVGKVPFEQSRRFSDTIRLLKIKGENAVINDIHGFPSHMEVAVIINQDNVFPGIFLSTDSGRFVRPVKYLATGEIEILGPLEQVYMEIACTPDDVRLNETTHIEISPLNILSVNASFVPFSDHNQSPRNMYQCQMGKQTMGTPIHSYHHRSDNKLYRIQNPQKPIVQNGTHDLYKSSDYPAGANAVVAVISYTGYDMEDACIISKSSYERGFGHASVYANYIVDLNEIRMRGEPVHHRFGNKIAGSDQLVTNKLDIDGLPFIGQTVEYGDPLYCIINDVTNTSKIVTHKSLEPAIVSHVRIIAPLKGDTSELQLMHLILRYNRNPVMGDKFSSRHGQKGVLSFLWPQEDMPFSESGMNPDLIINPHAFPSRMTIGMLIESMASKSGALHGIFQDGSPFRYNENFKAVDFFGSQLLKSGYSYYGSEPMYSGITGASFPADIYIGLVYYQRLRHMVSDKSQVRSVGAVNPLHRQPVKGRKKGGGIRFGEMERDSLLAHGVSFMLHDRLMNGSDYHVAPLCSNCGNLLSPVNIPALNAHANDIASNIGRSITNRTASKSKGTTNCKNCDTDKYVYNIAIPYVFIFLVNELVAMNIRITLDVK